MPADSTTKRCRVCKEVKARTEFYRNRSTTDGLAWDCRTCSKAYIRRDDVKLRNRIRNRRYSARVGPRAGRPEVRRGDSEELMHVRARKALRNAVRDGKVVKPDSCERCARHLPARQIQAHHEDYARPLDVKWYCAPCHGEVHHPIPSQERRSA